MVADRHRRNFHGIAANDCIPRNLLDAFFHRIHRKAASVFRNRQRRGPYFRLILPRSEPGIKDKTGSKIEDLRFDRTARIPFLDFRTFRNS